MKKSFFTESILYWLARGLCLFCQAVPPWLSLSIGQGLGSIAYHTFRYRREMAIRNLRWAFGRSVTEGELQRIAKRIFQNLGMTFMEIAFLPRIDRAYTDRWIQIAPGSRERLENAISQGHGVILLTAHFGNWELASILGALNGYPVLVLARAQGWPRLNGLLNLYRESKGCRVVSKGFSVRELIRGLQQGKIVGILADQDGGRHGILSPFFNRLASTAPGAIALGVSTQAPVLPVFLVRREGASHTLFVEEPLAIPSEGSIRQRLQAGVVAYLARLEQVIRRSPDQWLWLHRRWKSSPTRRLLLLSDGRPGHLSQLKAFAQRIEEAWRSRQAKDRRLEGIQSSLIQTETVEVQFHHPLGRFLTTLWASFLPRFFIGNAGSLLRLALRKECFKRLQGFQADWSVSCGAAAASVNLLVSRRIGSRAIQILQSRLPSWRRFDLGVIPKHDLGTGPSRKLRVGPFRLAPRPNLLVIDGALTQESSVSDERQLDKWCDLLGVKENRRIGLLVGGPTRGIRWQEGQILKIVQGLLKASEVLDAKLMATTSRRTPPWLEKCLFEILQGDPHCRLLVLVNQKENGKLQDPSEAIPCILGLADVLVVSGDSISMVSEAAATLKPVVSFLPSGDSTKHHRFLRDLDASGKVKIASPEGVGEAVVELIWGQESGSRRKGPLESPDPVKEFLLKWL